MKNIYKTTCVSVASTRTVNIFRNNRNSNKYDAEIVTAISKLTNLQDRIHQLFKNLA